MIIPHANHSPWGSMSLRQPIYSTANTSMTTTLRPGNFSYGEVAAAGCATTLSRRQTTPRNVAEAFTEAHTQKTQTSWMVTDAGSRSCGWRETTLSALSTRTMACTSKRVHGNNDEGCSSRMAGDTSFGQKRPRRHGHIAMLISHAPLLKKPSFPAMRRAAHEHRLPRVQG